MGCSITRMQSVSVDPVRGASREFDDSKPLIPLNGDKLLNPVAEQPKVTREWKVLPSVESEKKKFIADGSLDENAPEDYFELRSLFDNDVGCHFIVEYLISLGMLDTYFCWSDVQNFRQVEIGSADSHKFGEHIYKKFIKPAKKLKDVDEKIENEHRENDNEQASTKRVNELVKKPLIDIVIDEEMLSKLAEMFDNTGEDDVSSVYDVTVYDWLQKQCFKQMYEKAFCKFKTLPQYVLMKTTMKLKYNHVKEKDFSYIKVIGEGGQGIVVEAIKKTTNCRYAIRIQTKKELMRRFKDNVWRADFEKQAFAACRHPFMVELTYAFQTNSMVMMVMTLGTNTDLAKVLETIPNGCLSVASSRFYIVELVSVLAYLHQKSMSYRDIKPGSILLNADGHIQLVDFGTMVDLNSTTLGICSDITAVSKLFSNHGLAASSSLRKRAVVAIEDSYAVSSGRVGAEPYYSEVRESEKSECNFNSNSIVNKCGYMAPELIDMMFHTGWKQKAYSNTVDWWSMGVLLYRFLMGNLPFEESSFLQITKPGVPEDMVLNSLFLSEANIDRIRCKVDFENDEECENTISLLQKWICKDVDRLGYGSNGYQHIQEHPYFNGIDWKAVVEKQVEPPSIKEEIQEQMRTIMDQSTSLQKIEIMEKGGRESMSTPLPPVVVEPVPMELDEILCSCGKESWLIPLRDDTKNIEKFEFWDYVSVPGIIAEEERAEELADVTQYSQSPVFGASGRKYSIF